MDRVILRCLTEDVRARYAEEIQELLEGSHRPVRDRADLVVAAIGLRLGRLLPWCMLGGTVLLGLSLATVIHSVANLSGGAVETFDHWWSTLAAGAFGASLAALALLSDARRRANSWSRSPTG